uniref:C-type lectin domain containing 11A n=1 Tax=Gouania willdenowi TaxID=441366 RepID=A0A8C5DSC2_GOUWI
NWAPPSKSFCNFLVSLYILHSCQKGLRLGYKCYLVYNNLADYAGASRKCMERGGRMAMPRDRREQEALADYVKSFFSPGNWPVWLGVNDLRSEGAYVFDDGTRVSYFQWRKHFLSSQPDGGRRENCVAMSSDDGDCGQNLCPDCLHDAKNLVSVRFTESKKQSKPNLLTL